MRSGALNLSVQNTKYCTSLRKSESRVSVNQAEAVKFCSFHQGCRSLSGIFHLKSSELRKMAVWSIIQSIWLQAICFILVISALRLSAVEVGDLNLAGKSESVTDGRRSQANEIFLRGNSHYQKGDFARAIEEYKVAIQLNPTAVTYYLNLGNCLREAGSSEDSIIVLQKAVFLNESNPKSWYNLGVTYQTIGMYIEAVEAYNRATLLSDGFVNAHYNKGKLYSIFYFLLPIFFIWFLTVAKSHWHSHFTVIVVTFCSLFWRVSLGMFFVPKTFIFS